MKKNYFALFGLFFLLFNVHAQNIEFKNSRLKALLLLADTGSTIAKNSEGNSIIVDENRDEEIQLSEALNISALDLSSYFIEDLSDIKNFVNLTKLECWGTSLSSLDVSELKELKYLNCSSNSILSLDVSALKKLETLVVAQGRLETIKLGELPKLHHLHLGYNAIESIDLSGLTNLQYIDIANNRLAQLDFTGLTKLEDLICNDNKIENFIKLTDCNLLSRIWTQNNELNNLDLSNCPSLFDLWAEKNNLTTIDLTTPKNINIANFNNNKLTSVIVKDYSNINEIGFSDNNLTTLDLSNFVNLKNITCKNNKQLKMLFLKNGKDEGVDIEGCDNLEYICNDDINNSQLDAYIKYYKLTNISINSNCTFGPGGNYSVISGTVKMDNNNNGCDDNDEGIPNLKFNISNGTSKNSIIGNVSGSYKILVGDETYTIEPFLENSSYFQVTPKSVSVTFPETVSPFVQNFCVTSNGSHQDLEISILSLIPARPGFDADYKIVYKNKGNEVKSGTVSLDFDDAVIDFVSAVPTIDNQEEGKLVWNYADLQPFETREILLKLNVNSPMETPAVNIDDRLSFNALIMPIENDEKPVDNSFAMRQIVVGSFDPNDKTCLEGEVVKPELIGEYVHYLIRFENTGTYPAENIVVKDMIDLSKFDISTLVPTSASHTYATKISDGNKVEFIFEKINLPFDDANNDGYIAFKIKTLPTLAVGDTFTNEANIYFDYNFPILTNKTSSTFKILGTPDFNFSSYFNVYPNPSKDILNISSNKDIAIKLLAIYDILGQVVIAVPNAGAVSSIDISRLKSGNYILKVSSDIGSSSTKFIKN